MAERLLLWTVERASILGGAALMLLALVVAADVAARAAGFALVGAAESSGVLLALLVFLALAYTQRQRGHVAIEAVTTMLPAPLRRGADLLSLLVCLGFTFLLTVSTGRMAWESYVGMEFQYGTLPFPIWPVRLVIALGFLLLALQLLSQIVAVGLALAGRRPGTDGTA